MCFEPRKPPPLPGNPTISNEEQDRESPASPPPPEQHFIPPASPPSPKVSTISPEEQDTDRSALPVPDPRTSRSLKAKHRNKRSPETPNFCIWVKHDELLAATWELARQLQSHIDRLKPIFEYAQRNTSVRRKLAMLEEKVDELDLATDLVQKTWDLYYWARDEGKAERPGNPFNTVPASESMYAIAIGLEGDKPVSPMRGVSELNARLVSIWCRVSRLDPMEEMGNPPVDLNEGT